MDKDLNDIAVFVAVVEARSFTKAGKQLGLPRSSVSRRVAQLEKRLGARLLQRTTRNLKLTDLGERYYGLCARSLSDIDEAERMILAAQAVPRGRLRITAPGDIGIHFLAPLITEFTRRYPDVQVDVMLTQRVVDLVGEGFDLALRAGPLPDSSLIARRIGGGSRRLVASPSYLERRGSPDKPADLSEHCCIVANDPRSQPTWTLLAKHDQVDVPVDGPIRVNDFSFAAEAAISGAGIAYLPTFLCRDPLADGRLVRILPDYQSAPGSLHVVYPSATHVSATVQAFRDFLLTEPLRQELADD
jgi:DNA-binding transcriptional LysR family regulator